MKVLVAHNRYNSRNPSGENRVVDEEIASLRTLGVQVQPLFRSSDKISTKHPREVMRAATGPLYAGDAVQQFKELLAAEPPDLVHVHNVFPLISPAIIRVAKQAGIPVVQTVHNYRHVCVNGLMFRAGRYCDDCLGRAFPSPALIHGCYRGSRLQSLPMVASHVIHRGTWQLVDRFIALSPFGKRMLVKAGIPAWKIAVKPTPSADAGMSTPETSDFVYVGRLDEPKGVELLLEAWRRARPLMQSQRLVIVGDGPLEADVEAAARCDPSIVAKGRLSPEEARTAMSSAAVVIVPSITPEGYPRVVSEAFSMGRPVVATDQGGLADIVDRKVGWPCPPTPVALAHAICEAASEIDERRTRGEEARSRWEAELSPERSIERLLSVYGSVLEAEPSRYRQAEAQI